MAEQSHQLAAIMFTDIVGYTSLMAQNQQQAMELVERNRVIQKPLVEKYSGTWHKDLGDGSLISFQSAIEAVNCGVEIQRQLREDPDLKLRIGIHLGDVTFKDEDVYGDGVNVASRIESIADPGGIYISESVQKAIRGRTEISIEALGEFYLKHVDYPVPVFALQTEGLPEPSTEQKQDGASIIEELTKRNVFRAALTYVVVGLLVFYGVDRFLPEVSHTMVVSVLFIGFATAIFLAWNYERSPAGFVKTTSKQAVVNPYTDSQKKPMTGWGPVVFLSVLVIALFLYPRFSGTTHASDDEISMAVIPFYNMSDDSTMNRFGLGMASSIATELSLSQGFDFISSDQATFRYANNRDITPVEIGEELNVTHLLMGSFQVAGDQISVNVQLVDAADGNRIREFPARDDLDNVFDLQTAISQGVLHYFSFNEDVQYRGTPNLEAYESYIDGLDLMGRQREYPNHLTSIMPVVIDHYEQAIQLDSSYLDAWVGLISAHSWLIWMNQSNQTAEGNNLFTPEQRQQRIKLIESYINYMDRFPDSWAKNIAKGLHAYWVNLDFDIGEKYFLQALAENPNAQWALLGAIYERKLDLANAVKYHHRATQLDNTDTQSWAQMGWSFWQSGDYERAELALDQVWQRGGTQSQWPISYLHNLGRAKLPLSDDRIQSFGNTYYWHKFYLNRDWENLTSFLDTIPTTDPSDWGNVFRKILAHQAMDDSDSAEYYAKKYLALPHQNPELRRGIPIAHAVLGNRESAYAAWNAIWEPRRKNGQDLSRTCMGLVEEIDLLVHLEEYDEATRKLTSLNRNHPEWGMYLYFEVSPEYDKIKVEYPPFLEALQNLKMPPKLEEGVIELM